MLLYQSWCSLCYRKLYIGKYEQINNKLICDDCNPKKTKQFKYIYVKIPDIDNKDTINKE